MRAVITELNTEHVKIEEMIHSLEFSIMGSNFLLLLKSKMPEIIEFSESILPAHHSKEENFLYKWMSDQNPNSDRALIHKMIEEHKYFEEKMKWISDELQRAHAMENYANTANLGYEMSLFVIKYKEHLQRETDFIFLIAEGLLLKHAH